MTGLMTAPRLYETGDIARAFGVSAAAVLKWERRGLVTPRRTVGGSRIFTEDDLATLRRAREERAAARAVRGGPQMTAAS